MTIQSPTKRVPYGGRTLLNPDIAVSVREWFFDRVEGKENSAITLTAFYNDYQKSCCFEKGASKPLFNRLFQELLKEQSINFVIGQRPSIAFYGVYLKD